MIHETLPSGQKVAPDGCCGGIAKESAAAPAVIRPDAKPGADAKHKDHENAGGSCC